MISVILNAHGNTPLVADTVDAIKTYVSDNILMVVDGATWDTWGKNVQLPVCKLKGFYHNYVKAPYRNLTFGLASAVDKWPDSDWFCYCEYDVLFVSNRFLEQLEIAKENNVWCLGNDHHQGETMSLPLLEMIIKEPIKEINYLLGCCTFYSGDFLRKLKELDFFSKFLTYTNDFTEGYFPDYDGFDFGEHLYPTLAVQYGRKVMGMAKWSRALNQWHGSFRHYPMRWKPEIQMEELDPEASIIHPVKERNEIRWFYKMKRQRNVSTKNSSPIVSIKPHKFFPDKKAISRIR